MRCLPGPGLSSRCTCRANRHPGPLESRGCGGRIGGFLLTRWRPDRRWAMCGGGQRVSGLRWHAAGGQGRTGTALAVLAILDGVAPAKAVLYVREHYYSKAVEPPWQRRFVARFRR